jgi:hypothetical protein
MTIHRPRGGHYWRYWVILIGGGALATAYLLTDGFGLRP